MKTSKYLNVSLSTVKFSVNNLEKKHNTKFFQKDGKVKVTTFRLTDSGLRVFNNLRPIFENFPYKKEEELLSNYQDNQNSKIDIRTTHGFMKFLLPNFIKNSSIDILNSIDVSQNVSYNFTTDIYSYNKNIPDIIITDKKIESNIFHNEKILTMKFSFFTSKKYFDKNFSLNSNIKQHQVFVFSVGELTKFSKLTFLENIHYIQNFDFLINICKRNLGIVLLPEISEKCGASEEFIKVLPELGYSIDVYLSHNKNQENKKNFCEVLNLIEKEINHQG